MILDNICGFSLDEEQRSVVYCKNKHILVCAGAGSGKSLTIIGKIRYLIEEKGVKNSDILVISFTNDTVKSLKNKLLDTYNYDIDVLTFHKLGLKILDDTGVNIDICSSDFLDYLIDEYFSSIILENEEWLKKILKYFKFKYKNIDSYKKFVNLNNKDFSNFKCLISRFIKLFRTNNHNIEDFYKILVKASKKMFHKKDVFVLRLILDIYLYYLNELKSSLKIDFDDMITIAIDKIEDISFSYKYLIIDEYQDTSIIKFEFIKKLLDKMNSNLLVVGDDFQSIYRFTGCDLNLFLNFKNYFEDSEILKITNTYRSPYELIEIAGSFVMSNKYQIKKDLKAIKKVSYPIEIIYSNNQSNALKKLLNNLEDEVMIIGRNNFDINRVINNDFEIDNLGNILYKNNPNLKIRYLTAHKSKGLESKNVIIINLINNIYGFPSLQKDERIIKYVNNYKTNYYLDEERRLFYVALTRTKNKVYLLTTKGKESIFIKELITKYRKKLIIKTYN